MMKQPISDKDTICAFAAAREEELAAISRYIWEQAEPANGEVHSAQCLSGYLERCGFTVRRGLAGMETAFLASWGQGEPHILFLAEYDALPAMGQADVSHPAPLPGKNGHACGHNLLGTGAVGAAAILKDYLETTRLSGTVSVMGCPAEETMEGKIRLADAGLFNGYTAALTWHPDSFHFVSEYRYQAMYSVRFSFYGTPSHAAVSPEAGRSALDAAELCNVGANYLREHIPPAARIHYIIEHGGEKPNIVPPYAQSWYYIRAPRNEIARDIYKRVCDIAQGAALMTGTRTEHEILSWCPETTLNQELNRLLQAAFEDVGPTVWDEKDLAFANDIQKTFSAEQIQMQLEQHGIQPETYTAGPLARKISPLTGTVKPFPASTDVSAVSATIPTGQILVAAYPIGTAGHTWPITACAGSQIGIKAALTAAKVLALSGSRLCQNHK